MSAVGREAIDEIESQKKLPGYGVDLGSTADGAGRLGCVEVDAAEGYPYVKLPPFPQTNHP